MSAKPPLLLFLTGKYVLSRQSVYLWRRFSRPAQSIDRGFNHATALRRDAGKKEPAGHEGATATTGGVVCGSSTSMEAEGGPAVGDDGADPAGSRHVARSDTGAGRHVGRAALLTPTAAPGRRGDGDGDGDLGLALSPAPQREKRGAHAREAQVTAGLPPWLRLRGPVPSSAPPQRHPRPHACRPVAFGRRHPTTHARRCRSLSPRSRLRASPAPQDIVAGAVVPSICVHGWLTSLCMCRYFCACRLNVRAGRMRPHFAPARSRRAGGGFFRNAESNRGGAQSSRMRETPS